MRPSFWHFAQLAARSPRDPLLPLWVLEVLAIAFLYIWIFWLGATVGSFINVVVYRLPRGLNLAYPGSACPRCGHPIRLHDNIPLLSWLMLRGRCRDCGVSISPRYFAVELLVATVFVLVLSAERHLPAAGLVLTNSRVVTRYDLWPFWSQYALHACLVTTLMAAVLIRADGFRVPPQMYLPVLAAGLVLPLVWPEIRGLPATPIDLAGWQAGLVDGLAGLVVGALLGLIVSLVVLFVRGAWPWTAPVALLATLCVVLGWQHGLVWSPVVLLGQALGARAVQFLGPPPGPTGLPPGSQAEMAASSSSPATLEQS
jgi:leader peptidase (prepilin peptidase)/N-methyltransferase